MRTPTYVIAPGKHQHNDESLNESGTGLRRISTPYSKPTSPSKTRDTDSYKDHHYAEIVGRQEGKSESEAYSYVYHQPHVVLTRQSVKAEERSGNGKGHYQGMGTMNYIEMYSKLSSLVSSREERVSPPPKEEGYTKLSTATLNAESVYTNPVHKPKPLEKSCQENTD